MDAGAGARPSTRPPGGVAGVDGAPRLGSSVPGGYVGRMAMMLQANEACDVAAGTLDVGRMSARRPR